MAEQIVLSWDVSVANTPLAAAAAATLLGNVPLYENEQTDPVLGQLFGLTVESDVTSNPDASTARRTLTLNMTSANGPEAPPPFPCHPRTSTPPELPYPLRRAVPLADDEVAFSVTNGSTTVLTGISVLQSVVIGDSVQFLSQIGTFYEVASIGASQMGLTTPYTGKSGSVKAFKEVAAPALRPALFSTSKLDTSAVATVPAITAGPGAQVIELTYLDSTGAGPFTELVSLTGRRPAAITFGDGGIDVAVIVSMIVETTGEFENSIGEITLVDLSEDLPELPPDLPLGTGIGAAQAKHPPGAPQPRTWVTMTDEGQLLIDRHLAYLPPSFFALAQQGASTPQLNGTFFVTTGITSVPTSEDQTSALSPGDVIQFAEQMGVPYTIAQVTNKIVNLTSAYTGIDHNNVGSHNPDANIGTKGNLGTKVTKKATGASVLFPSPAAAPTNSQLATLLAQFVSPDTAAPPPSPPLLPATAATPTFLSNIFTRTLALKLAGVPITARAIAFV